jgi:hypothetical protein
MADDDLTRLINAGLAAHNVTERRAAEYEMWRREALLAERVALITERGELSARLEAAHAQYDVRATYVIAMFALAYLLLSWFATQSNDVERGFTLGSELPLFALIVLGIIRCRRSAEKVTKATERVRGFRLQHPEAT